MKKIFAIEVNHWIVISHDITLFALDVSLLSYPVFKEQALFPLGK